MTSSSDRCANLCTDSCILYTFEILSPHVFSMVVFLTVSDAPGKPGKPTVDDLDADSVTLTWSKPKTDGGDRIQGEHAVTICHRMAGSAFFTQ